MKGGEAIRPRNFVTERERRRAVAADPRARLRAQLGAAAGLVLAAALPILLWHDVIAGTASEFRLDPAYLLGQWLPWTLMAAGLAFSVPVAASAGRDPDSRWYPRSRNAYAGWGITLYLLGVVLAVQVAQLYALQAG